MAGFMVRGLDLDSQLRGRNGRIRRPLASAVRRERRLALATVGLWSLWSGFESLLGNQIADFESGEDHFGACPGDRNGFAYKGLFRSRAALRTVLLSALSRKQ